ncbi:MAG: SpoIIE family protein phosphatase [Spirochaetales bacterium]|nr:SpoIIE family protein phosphatase [Spirochaetales bacterium]
MNDEMNPGMENEVSQSKHHLESIFDSITEPIFTVNSSYEITRLNKKFELLMGNTFKEILGEKCYTQLYKQTTMCPDCPLNKVVNNQERISFKITVEDSIIYNVNCFPLMNKKGDIIAMVECARDITEEEQIRKELLILQQQTLQKSLQLAKQSKEIEIAYNKLSRELTLARIVQRGILPQQLPKLNELRTAVYYLPMEDVGGDLYDFIHISPDILGVIIADVSGHGIPAAFIAAMAKMSFYQHTINTKSTARVLTQVNRDMCTNLHLDEFFFTTTYCLIDLITNRVTYSNAGHPPILIYREANNTVEEINNRGLIMGLNSDAKYSEVEIQLNKGDRLVFYTDGVIESSKGNNEKFGLNRLKDSLLKTSTFPVDSQINSIENDLHNFLDTNNPSDDVTLLILEATLDSKFECFHLSEEFESNKNVMIQAVRHPLEFEKAIGNALGIMDNYFFHDLAIRNTKFAIYEALNMYYHSSIKNNEPMYFAFHCDKDFCTVVIVDSRYFIEDDIFPYYRSNANNHSMNIIIQNVDEYHFKDGGKKIVLIKYNK